MTTQVLFIINLAVLLLIVALAGYTGYSLYSLKKLKGIFLEEDQPENLEEILASVARKIKALDKKSDQHTSEARRLAHQLGYGVQKLGMIRFNSFADQGGNLSFVIALLDEHDSGVVLTNMHGREQNRIYAKEVIAGTSDSQLTEEEQGAIHQAMSGWKKQIQQQKTELS